MGRTKPTNFEPAHTASIGLAAASRSRTMAEPEPFANISGRRSEASTRLWAAGGMLLAAAFGLGSRIAPMATWPIIGPYGGDAAWAMAAYAGWRFVFPGLDRRWIAGLALGLATTVEVSQLADWDWLNSIRAERVGALLLGRGFLWSDLAAYAVGTITAMALGSLIDVPRRRPDAAGTGSPTSRR
ncbi:MAG: DUF2809 domain-containing protein [Phycisphaera sp. TMED9]|nr:MAG: DUF2809 domain-containing protein [Phycisphaera sp. TMED9]